MYNPTTMPGETIGETTPNAAGETDPFNRAAEWENAMEDADAFQGEWGYGAPPEFVASSSSETSKATIEASGMSEATPSFTTPETPEAPEAAPTTENFNQDFNPNQELTDASRLTSYGFDTVCRVYDLNTVLTKIRDTDITSGEAVFNPLGKIYEAIEPRPEARAHLFREIQKDFVVDNQQNDDPNLNTAQSPLGITSFGEMYDKRLLQKTPEQTSFDAIKAFKDLLNALDTEPRFEPLRQRAVKDGKTVIEILVGDTVNPTMTTFLNGVGSELAAGSVEEVLDKIESTELTEADDDLAKNVAETPANSLENSQTMDGADGSSAINESDQEDQELTDWLGM